MDGRAFQELVVGQVRESGEKAESSLVMSWIALMNARGSSSIQALLPLPRLRRRTRASPSSSSPGVVRSLTPSSKEWTCTKTMPKNLGPDLIEKNQIFA